MICAGDVIVAAAVVAVTVAWATDGGVGDCKDASVDAVLAITLASSLIAFAADEDATASVLVAATAADRLPSIGNSRAQTNAIPKLAATVFDLNRTVRMSQRPVSNPSLSIQINSLPSDSGTDSRDRSRVTDCFRYIFCV